MKVKTTKIGVKYCGGCNPRFDRGQAVEELRQRLGAERVQPVREGEEYDVILLVCGCQARCIRDWRGSLGKEYLVLDNEADFQEFIW